LGQWRETVDNRLQALERAKFPLGADCPMVKDGSADNDKKPDDENSITWKWLVEKIFVPGVMALVIWFLLTVLPNLLKTNPLP
jgi:hypothetical protein